MHPRRRTHVTLIGQGAAPMSAAGDVAAWYQPVLATQVRTLIGTPMPVKKG
ncbi:hypothetical protein ABZ897_60185 [Nonomuraea sp. NPDC046802]|uniref:hypothetical protein n=1 Tax=Nonomuraea sp. NPDC046802 TaxID=3154919 RepID=UPI003405D2C5